MKRGLTILVFNIFVLSIFSFGFVSAQSSPFKIEKLSYSGSMNVDVENKLFFENLPSNWKDLPHYYFYLNGIYFSSNPMYVGSYDSVKSSFTSSNLLGSEFYSENSIQDSLKAGENELIVGTGDLTIDKNGNFINSMIINQFSIDNNFYQRLSSGEFVLCSHYVGNERIIDNPNCIFEDGGIRDNFNYGPNVGVSVKFDLTQEQLNSGSFEIEDFYSTKTYYGIPSLNVQFGGELVGGRKIFLTGTGGELNKFYSIYFNDNLVKQTKTNGLGGFKDTFELNQNWINQNENNKLILKDDSGNSFGTFVSPYYPFNDPSQADNEWKAFIVLNDSSGFYGDEISIYGIGLKPNKEYTLKIRYEGVPGGSEKVTTNSLGEFEYNNFEIDPPVLSDILIFVKNIFRGQKDFSSDEEITKAINNLDSVTIVVEIANDGEIGTDFHLCDNVPEYIKERYC